MRGSSVEAGGKYVAPEQAVPRAKLKDASGITEPSRSDETISVVFYEGDEVFPRLLEFAAAISFSCWFSTYSR
jgi:hypothetical protein